MTVVPSFQHSLMKWNSLEYVGFGDLVGQLIYRHIFLQSGGKD